MLEGLRFKRAAVNDRLALGVFVDAVADGFFRFLRISTLDRPAFARLREMALDVDTVFLGSRAPFRLETFFVAMILGEPGPMRDILRRLGTRQPFARERLARCPGDDARRPSPARACSRQAPSGRLDRTILISYPSC